jgi:hypothetical protein
MKIPLHGDRTKHILRHAINREPSACLREGITPPPLGFIIILLAKINDPFLKSVKLMRDANNTTHWGYLTYRCTFLLAKDGKHFRAIIFIAILCKEAKLIYIAIAQRMHSVCRIDPDSTDLPRFYNRGTNAISSFIYVFMCEIHGKIPL